MGRDKKLPKIIQEVGFDFDWSEEKVWKLDVPVEEIDTSELEWNIDTPFWWTKGGYYNLKPREVLENPEKHKERYKKVMNSDLSYPLDIMWWRGKWVFLDGLHRFAKAYVLGHKKVRARKIPQEAIPLIKK